MSERRFTMPVAVHLLLMQEDGILLLRRFNTGYEDGNYSVIAGHLDGDEGIMQVMIREAKEEAMIELESQDLNVVGVMHRKFVGGEAINFFLTAKTWRGRVTNGEPDKCDKLSWYSLDQLPENIIPYVRKALENYRSGIWFESYGW